MLAVQIAYLINQYPKVSHTFIRREIQALERLGIAVHRFAIRGWDEHQVDTQDQAEQARTRYVLQGGPALLARGVVSSFLRAPRRTLAALVMATRLSRHADRPLAVTVTTESAVSARLPSASLALAVHGKGDLGATRTVTVGAG